VFPTVHESFFGHHARPRSAAGTQIRALRALRHAFRRALRCGGMVPEKISNEFRIPGTVYLILDIF